MSAHKWWRLNSIFDRNNSQDYLAAAEIHFYDSSSANIATDPSKAFSSASYNDSSEYAASKAFDGNPDTFASGKTLSNWFIGYQFSEPVEVVAVGIKGRNDLPAGLGREWQTAVVEFSDDGVIWSPYAKIAPNIAAEDSALKIVQILSASRLSINTMGDSAYLNVYTADESGSISGQVQEKGLPIKAEVALHDRLTRKTVAIAWSDNSGNYLFNGLDKNREYYAEALHPTRKFNLVGQDGLKSGMTA